MSVEGHRARAASVGRLRCVVVTVSDTRSLEDDLSGHEIVRHLESHGHEALERTVVPDDPQKIALVVRHWLAADVDAVVLNGGTGVSSRDGTVEVVRRLLDCEIPGFGELFRSLSYDEIGAAAMLSRALGGVAAGKAVFALPGSPAAVTLAMEKLILPELPHLVAELRRP